ncbi:hypothetical protein [Endozoicomonas sp. ALE010]
MTDMPMSVVIITLNEEKNIGRLLDDLQQQLFGYRGMFTPPPTTP